MMFIGGKGQEAKLNQTFIQNNHLTQAAYEFIGIIQTIDTEFLGPVKTSNFTSDNLPAAKSEFV